MQYYLVHENQQMGPFNKIEDLIATGLLTQESLVWHANLSQWTPASKLPELKIYFATPPPIPVKTSPPPIPSEPISSSSISSVQNKTNTPITNKPIPSSVTSQEAAVRYLGWFIDTIVYLTLTLIIGTVVSITDKDIHYLLYMIISLGCEILLLMGYQKTPSKFFFSTKVIKSDKSFISPNEAVERAVLRLGGGGIICIAYLISKDKIFYHDKRLSMSVVTD